MIGTVLNVAGILIGGVAGLVRRKPLTPANESFFKVTLGVFTVWFGLRLTWLSLRGSFLEILKQLVIVVVALMLGKLVGHLLGLQKLSNRLGRSARDLIGAPDRAKRPPSEGLKACAILFCAAPLGIVGALEDGVHGYFAPLAIKAVIDGLACMGFVSLFGWSALLSVVPVLAWQGSLTLLGSFVLKPFLEAHALVDPFNAVAGLLVFSVSLVVLNLKRLELADYLPSLAFAPLLAWVFR